jgi:hypothetical protein
VRVRISMARALSRRAARVGPVVAVSWASRVAAKAPLEASTWAPRSVTVRMCLRRLAGSQRSPPPEPLPPAGAIQRQVVPSMDARASDDR